MAAHNFDPVEVAIFLKGVAKAYRALRDFVTQAGEVGGIAKQLQKLLKHEKPSEREKRELMRALKEAVEKWSEVNQLITERWPEVQADLSRLADSHQELASAATKIAESFWHIGELFSYATNLLRNSRATIEGGLSAAEKHGLDVTELRENLGKMSETDDTGDNT